jgi:MYXO-CTERM domain-containing protein
MIALLLSTLLASPPAPIELRLASGETELVSEPAHAHGLPVRGAYTIWAQAEDGSRRLFAARDAGPVRLRPDQARVTLETARALAATRLGCAPQQLEPSLVYLRQLGEAVLAWEVTSPLELGTPPTRQRLWLSATTGAQLARRSLVFDSGALLYPENPSSTPVPIAIEFSTIDVATADVPLASPTIDVRGCIDAPDGPAPMWWVEGQCFPHARARSDDAGDYFVPLPDIGLIADNEAFDDEYAEVAAYWYVEQFFARMAERGLTSARCEHFTVVVNRYSLDEDGERIPAGGASFVDECNADVSPTLIIGQGEYVDYAYDSDTLFHEMGHSVIQHLSPDGLTDRQLTELGIISEAGALNEGIADYMAMMLAGDPEVGEYIGRVSVDQTTPYIRSGINDKVCPNDLIGQWHNDGQVVSGALWSARDRVGPVVDEILLQTLPKLPPDASLEDFGQAFLATTAEFVEAGTLDELGFELVERSLAGRGLLGCLHIIDDVELATEGKRMQLIADDDSIAPFGPGPLQLRYEVPPGETEVTVFFSMSAGEEPAATVLMRIGGEPIHFSYELIDDVITVSGDWDIEVEAEALNSQDFIARVAVNPGDVLHVALANRSAVGASVSNFFVVASEAAAHEDEEPGCGCTSAPTGGWGALALLLGLVGLRRERAGR